MQVNIKFYAIRPLVLALIVFCTHKICVTHTHTHFVKTVKSCSLHPKT